MSVAIMARVWAESQRKGNELLLLLAIADNANDDGYCWPGIEYLADKTRVNRRSVIRLMKGLETSGELFVSHNRRTGNKYIVKTGLSDEDFMVAMRKYFGASDEAISDILSHKTADKISDMRVTSEVTQPCHIRSDTAMSLQPSLTINEPLEEKENIQYDSNNSSSTSHPRSDPKVSREGSRPKRVVSSAEDAQADAVRDVA